jgi:hypothetical protein
LVWLKEVGPNMFKILFTTTNVAPRCTNDDLSQQAQHIISEILGIPKCWQQQTLQFGHITRQFGLVLRVYQLFKVEVFVSMKYRFFEGEVVGPLQFFSRIFMLV